MTSKLSKLMECIIIQKKEYLKNETWLFHERVKFSNCVSKGACILRNYHFLAEVPFKAIKSYHKKKQKSHSKIRRKITLF